MKPSSSMKRSPNRRWRLPSSISSRGSRSSGSSGWKIEYMLLRSRLGRSLSSSRRRISFQITVCHRELGTDQQSLPREQLQRGVEGQRPGQDQADRRHCELLPADGVVCDRIAEQKNRVEDRDQVVGDVRVEVGDEEHDRRGKNCDEVKRRGIGPPLPKAARERYARDGQRAERGRQ